MRVAFRSCALILVAFAALAFAQSNQQTSAVPSALPAAYQHWLDEDVRWIISADELKAFEALTDNHERDHFVVQFWLRRDPTPGTSESEFKEEHYRRLAYSNQHFASRTLGDLSDRGRVYIVYGPPDSIQQRTVHGLSSEIWHYDAFSSSGELIGFDGRQSRSGKRVDLEFVDNCQCGDYRLTTPIRN